MDERKALPIGYDDFSEVIERNLYYVDKTMFIKELLDDNTKVSLFTRPRRFGKTLNMSMLRYFFENGWDIAGKKMEYRHLFDGLKIAKCGEKYMSQQGKYPVIILTLNGAKQNTWEESFYVLKEQIASEFDRHRFILEDGRLAGYKTRYEKLMCGAAEDKDYNTSLAFLSRCLYIYFQEKAIILIDEYDVPLETAYLNHFYDKMISFIRSLFESALKTNVYLNFAVLTGCLRVSKESIFTGMNNLRIYSILNEKYADTFGFTDQDVRDLCEYYQISSRYETLKDWYNGYLFGRSNVYSPWSVVLQADEYCTNIDAFPISHWANSSSNSVVRRMINMADMDTRKEIEQIIHGTYLEKPVHEDITYDEVYENMDNLWNFMFFTGYFKAVGTRVDDVARYVTLAIPNKEVKYIFVEKISKWFNEKVVRQDRSELLRAFLGVDASAFQDAVNKVLVQCISYHDYYENFYHGVLTGILSGMDRYSVRSNRETGNGRSDIYVKPASIYDPAYVIEVKVAERADELPQKADEAIAQIHEKNYDAELHADGYHDVIHYGIAFFGKSCMVKAEGSERKIS